MSVWTKVYVSYTLDNNLILVFIFFFFYHIVQTLKSGSSLSWLLCLLYIPPLFAFVVVVHLLSHLWLFATTMSSFLFPASVLEPSTLPRRYGSFYWRIELETKIWVPYVYINTGLPMLLGTFCWQSKKIHVSILADAYTHIYQYLHMSPSYLYWTKHEFIMMSSNLIH